MSSYYPPRPDEDGDRKLAHQIASGFYNELTKHFGVTFCKTIWVILDRLEQIYLTIRANLPEIGDAHMTMIVKEIKPGMV